MHIGTVGQISRDDLKEALSTTDLVEPDTEILDKLFTMFDTTGEQWVFYNDFLAGINIVSHYSHCYQHC